MLYREYQNKMQRVEDFLLKLWHFRFLILAVVVAALAFVITMTSVAGIVSDVTECPPEIVYGEENPYRAKAVFQNVRYEYRSENSGAWTEEVPRRIGGYWVRAVSEGAGKKGETHFFRIIPRAIEVGVKKDWVYGETPTPEAVPVEGDTVVCTQFTYRLGEGVFSSSYGQAYITPVQEDVRILRGEEDVTDCYSVSVTEDKVRVTPRKLTITVKNAEKVYDGTPLTCSEYEITEGSLVFDDELELEFSAELVEAGKAQNVPKVQVIGDGTTRNDFYAVRVVAGELSVTKRPLSVTVGNRQKEYDGTPLEAGGALPEGSDVQGLVAGHSIQIFGTESVLAVGSLTFKPDVTVLDSDGEDVTKNYALSVTAGTLTVTPRPIVLSTPSVEWIYDGDPQIMTQESDCALRYAGSDPEQTGALAEGDSWSILRSGPCYNECFEADGGPRENGVLIMIRNEQTSDVRTDCYFITYEYGTVLTKPRPITVISHDRTWQYDGQPHGCTEEDIELSPTSMALVTRGTETDRIVFSEALSFVTDVWDSPIESRFTATVRYGEGEGYDMSKYYDINYSYGKVRISPRPVMFESKDKTWEYDGEIHFMQEGDMVVSVPIESLPLIQGHTPIFTPDPQACIRDVKQSPVENAFSVRIADASGTDVTLNYTIETRFGSLSILPRAVTIVTDSEDFVYDGEEHENLSYHVSSANDFLQGHYFRITEGTKVRDVLPDAAGAPKQVENRPLAWTITDMQGTDLSDNYGVSCTRYGILRVTPRPITVRTQSAETEYDGTLREYRELEVVSREGLVLDHVLMYEGPDFTEGLAFDRVDAGSWQNKVIVGVFSPSAQESVSENYAFSFEYGTVEIARRALTVRSLDEQVIYNGERQLVCKVEVVGEPIAETDRLEPHPDNLSGRTDVGAVSIRFTVTLTSPSRGEDADVTKNYEIEYLFGTLTVLPRPVTVRTGSASFPYDGLPHSCGEFWAEPSEDGNSGLVLQHKVFRDSRSPLPEQTEPGKLQNAFEVYIAEVGDIGAKDMSGNYEIIYLYGTISVVPRKLAVRTPSARFEYDGEPHTKTDGFEAVDPSSLLAGHSLVLAGEPVSITDVGKVKNWLLFTVVDASGRDVSRYYEIEATEFCGDLEVYPRPITVKTDSGSFVYDGKPHAPTFVQVTSQKGTVKGQQVVFAGMDGDPSEPDDRITVGVWSNRVKVSIEDPSAEGDARYKTGNYKITYEYGWVTITQRKIKLSSPDINAVYDGEPKRSYSTEIKLVEGEIADGQRMHLTFFTERTDVGREENIFTYEIFSATKAVVTSNYAIEYEYGIIEITPRYVEIVTASNSDMFYDGQEQSYPYFTYGQTSPYRFVEKHSVQIVGATIIREAGSKKNEFRRVIVLDEKEREVTSNYRISIENSGVLFMRYRLIITLFDVSKVYDGTPLSYQADDWYIEDGDNLGDLTVGFTLRGSLQTPGSLDMEIIKQLPITVSRYGSVLSKSYYTVEFSGTPLTIWKRHIEIASDSVKKYYDETPLTAPGWHLSFGTLAAGHTIEVTVTGRQEVPGTSENKIEKCIIYDARHNDVTACYEIIYRPGTLELIE